MAKRLPKFTKDEQDALQNALPSLNINKPKLTNTQLHAMYHTYVSMPHSIRRDKQEVLKFLIWITASVQAISRGEVHKTIENDADCKEQMILLRYLVSVLDPSFTRGSTT